MAKYELTHIGINASNATEAKEAVDLFKILFGFPIRDDNWSFFAGDGIEIMKEPYMGTHGHIAIGTDDVPAAQAELEAKGFQFDFETAKYRPDGTLNVIYLKNEICGFAIHLVCNRPAQLKED